MAGRKIREESLGEIKLERQELIQENKELVFENERIRRQNTMLIETLDAVANNEIISDPNIIFRLKTVLKNIEEMQ